MGSAGCSVHHCILSVLHCSPDSSVDSRIVEYVNWYLISRFIQRFPNVEGPQQSRNADKSALLSKCLACTNTSAPSESHISTLVWKRSMVWAVFQESLGVESIRIREICLVSVDRPHVPLRPSILWNQPSLFQLSDSHCEGYFIILTLYLSS
jgi:hypothetical protein